MPRMSRLIVPAYPHHVTQRGVRSMDIFPDDDARWAYLQFLSEEAKRFGVQFLSWCLMTNHVISLPSQKICSHLPEHSEKLTGGTPGCVISRKGCAAICSKVDSVRVSLMKSILLRQRGTWSGI